MPSIEVLALADLPDAADPGWSAWLTQEEIANCRRYERSKEHLAARVAGKLAIFSEARTAGGPVAHGEWQDIEISQGHGQPPIVRPGGGPAVSLSHAAGWVAALAWWPVKDGVEERAG